MAYTISLGSITKKVNSTKNSATWTYPSISAGLKMEEVSIINPVFEFYLDVDAGSLDRINYLNAFGCYYWVDDIVSLRNNKWRVSCTRDALGTFASTIHGANTYCTRTNVGGNYDKNYFDNIIAPSSKIKKAGSISFASPFTLGAPTTVFGFDGSGQTPSLATVTNFYYTNSTSASGIIAWVFTTQGVIDDIVMKLHKIGNNISMVKVFPFTFSGSTSGASSSVYLGEITVSGVPNLQYLDIDTFTANGTHSRRFSWQHTFSLANARSGYDDYRNYDGNFVKLSVRLPFVGKVALEPWVLKYNNLEVTYTVDMITGVGECNLIINDPVDITDVSTVTLGVYNCQMGFDIPISTYVSNIAQITNDIIQMNPAATAIDILTENTTMSTMTQASGMANYQIANIYIDYIIYDSEDFTYSSKGYKCMKNLTMGANTGSGYYEFLNPSVAPPGATKSEIEYINATMRGGIWKDA